MEIIDAQLHQPAPWTPWKYGEESLRELEIELVLAHMDAAGVDRAIIMAYPEWSAAATAAHPDRLASVPTYDHEAPDIEEQVAGALARQGVLGLRITPAFPPENVERLRAGSYDRFLAAAQEHDVPVAIFLSGYISELGPVARKYPSLTLVVDHLGLRQPPLMAADDPPWRDLDDLLALAEFPNVSVKVSGAPTLSADPYPYPDIWPRLTRVFEAFGMDRCMWGTDQHRVFGRIHGLAEPLPRYPGYHDYAEGVHFLLDRDDLSASDKEALFGGTLRKIMRWES